MADEILVVVQPADVIEMQVTVSTVGDGAPGVGVPVGGTTGQSLVKASAVDYDTVWDDVAGGGGGAVDSVNTQTGVVVLDAADVGADVSGAAAAAQAAATAAAASDATTKANAAQSGAIASSAGSLATHEADTTAVHGITNTALLETATGAQAKVDVETARATAAEATKATTAALTAHTGDTANPHAVTKAQVGLGSADNTADTAKPVSTAQATADTAIGTAAATDATTKANAAQAAAIQRANHTGTQSADTLTDGTTNKAFLATERTKLAGVATAATANDTDANLKARANHTGTQTMSTISDAGTAATVNTGTTSGTIPLLSTGDVLPIARLATGTPDGTKYIRDDGTLVTPAGGGGGTDFSDPSINGLLSWSHDPSLLTATYIHATGRMLLVRIPWPVTATPDKIWVVTSAVGTPTAGQCFAGLYNASGTLLYSTADISATVTAGSTTYSLALVSPAAVTGGSTVFLYAALLMNHSGTYSFSGPAAATGTANAGIVSASASRCLRSGTGITALPTPVTLSGYATQIGPWMGVS